MLHTTTPATDASDLSQLPLASLRAVSHDGSVRLSGNWYWSAALREHAGRKVLLRFDPDAQHTGVQVYTMDNVYIGRAECVAVVGFADTQTAREHASARRQHITKHLEEIQARQMKDQL